MTEENVQKLLRQESYIEEERRCLDWCIENQDECEEGEIEELGNTIDELEQKLEEDRVKFDKDYENKD